MRLQRRWPFAVMEKSLACLRQNVRLEFLSNTGEMMTKLPIHLLDILFFNKTAAGRLWVRANQEPKAGPDRECMN